MKLKLFFTALLLVASTAFATDVPPIVPAFPNHVVLGEAADTLTSPAMVNRQVWPTFTSPADKTLFKEIVPCRLVDTRVDNTPFVGLEARNYPFAGVALPSTNDCFGKIPPFNMVANSFLSSNEAPVVALTLQITSYNDGVTTGYMTFGWGAGFVPKLHSDLQSADGFLFYEGKPVVVQAGTVTTPQSPFVRLWNANGTTNVTIDILGYHLNDPAVGETGARGFQGETGLNGKDGINGTNGTNGTDGKDGINGTNGKDGLNGTNGTNGKDGKDGLNGTNGVNGTNGKDGKDGKDGLDGKDGGPTCFIVDCGFKNGHPVSSCDVPLGSVKSLVFYHSTDSGNTSNGDLAIKTDSVTAKDNTWLCYEN